MVNHNYLPVNKLSFLLEDAYQTRDVSEVYRILESLPDGVVLDIDKTRFTIAETLGAEDELMEISLAERREVALILSRKGGEVFRGSSLSVGIDDYYPELQRALIDAQEEVIFSHTHWSTDVSPFPSWDDVLWWIRDPNLENRIVFRCGGQNRAFSFINFYGELFSK